MTSPNVSEAIFHAFDDITVRTTMREAMCVPALLNTTIELVLLTGSADIGPDGSTLNSTSFADWLYVSEDFPLGEWLPSSARSALGLTPLPSLAGSRRRLQVAANASAVYQVNVAFAQSIPPPRSLFAADPSAALAAQQQTLAATTQRINSLLTVNGALLAANLNSTLALVASVAGVSPSAFSVVIVLPPPAAPAPTPPPWATIGGGLAAAAVVLLTAEFTRRRGWWRLSRASADKDKDARGATGARVSPQRPGPSDAAPLAPSETAALVDATLAAATALQAGGGIGGVSPSAHQVDMSFALSPVLADPGSEAEGGAAGLAAPTTGDPEAAAAVAAAAGSSPAASPSSSPSRSKRTLTSVAAWGDAPVLRAGGTASPLRASAKSPTVDATQALAEARELLALAWAEPRPQAIAAPWPARPPDAPVPPPSPSRAARVPYRVLPMLGSGPRRWASRNAPGIAEGEGRRGGSGGGGGAGRGLGGDVAEDADAEADAEAEAEAGADDGPSPTELEQSWLGSSLRVRAVDEGEGEGSGAASLDTRAGGAAPGAGRDSDGEGDGVTTATRALTAEQQLHERQRRERSRERLRQRAQSQAQAHELPQPQSLAQQQAQVLGRAALLNESLPYSPSQPGLPPLPPSALRDGPASPRTGRPSLVLGFGLGLSHPGAVPSLDTSSAAASPARPSPARAARPGAARPVVPVAVMASAAAAAAAAVSASAAASAGGSGTRSPPLLPSAAPQQQPRPRLDLDAVLAGLEAHSADADADAGGDEVGRERLRAPELDSEGEGSGEGKGAEEHEHKIEGGDDADADDADEVSSTEAAAEVASHVQAQSAATETSTARGTFLRAPAPTRGTFLRASAPARGTFLRARPQSRRPSTAVSSRRASARRGSLGPLRAAEGEGAGAGHTTPPALALTPAPSHAHAPASPASTVPVPSSALGSAPPEPPRVPLSARSHSPTARARLSARRLGLTSLVIGGDDDDESLSATPGRRGAARGRPPHPPSVAVSAAAAALFEEAGLVLRMGTADAAPAGANGAAGIGRRLLIGNPEAEVPVLSALTHGGSIAGLSPLERARATGPRPATAAAASRSSRPPLPSSLHRAHPLPHLDTSPSDVPSAAPSETPSAAVSDVSDASDVGFSVSAAQAAAAAGLAEDALWSDVDAPERKR